MEFDFLSGLLPDRHSSNSSQSFPSLNDQQPPSGSLKDSLFVTRYNNAMVAASELCLTDRLTELRHGLSGTNPASATAAAAACGPYAAAPHHFNNLAFLATGHNNGNLPYFAVSHGSYSLLSAGHGYYNGNHPAGSSSRNPNTSIMSGMFLTPPMVPPSLLYSQFYSSQNAQTQQLQNLVANGDTRSSTEDETVAQQRQLDSCAPSVSRDSSTSDSILQSECSSNHSSVDARRSSDSRQRETVSQEGEQLDIATTNSRNANVTTELFEAETNRHTQSDSNLWRPY